MEMLLSDLPVRDPKNFAKIQGAAANGGRSRQVRRLSQTLMDALLPRNRCGSFPDK